MDAMKMLEKYVNRINPRIMSVFIKSAKKIPAVNRTIQKEFDGIINDMEKSVKPYKGKFPSYSHLPGQGRKKRSILKEMRSMQDLEEARWKRGYASGAVYHGDNDHIDFLNKVYALHSQSNPLHSDLWPSAVKYEAEIVSMTARMLGSGSIDDSDSEKRICGVITSGGTESILLAMKTYRDWARAAKGIKKPEMVVPVTAHAAFDKAAQYFSIKIKRIPVDDNYRADIEAARKLITKNTIVVVGSAPSFPHGIVDPIAELSRLARERGVGFHTDACLGGFVLPWAERLGYDVPSFDFRLPGVTSISADTHKYGYAAKGTSVILYRGEELRHFQYFKTTDWPGGLYFSPTFAGSRPGALSAACWASMQYIGEDGYLAATEKILETADRIKAGIDSIPELYILGNPLWNIAFGSESLDIYRVMEFMGKREWSLNGLHKPASIHICVTLRHVERGVAKRFLRDLRMAVKHVKENPQEKGDIAPVYGLAATLPDRSLIADMLDRYIDLLYKV